MAKLNWKSQESIDLEIEIEHRNEIYKKEKELAIDSILFAVRNMVKLDDLTEEEINDIIALYRRWEKDTEYVEGETLRYGNTLYKVLTPGKHISQEQYPPSEVPSMYAPIGVPGTVREWEQRDGSNPYMLGDVVIFDEKRYTCNRDYVTHSPLELPVAWDVEIKENEVSEWVQKSYFMGEKCLFEGVTYESIFEGENVWSPKGYPQGWKVV